MIPSCCVSPRTGTGIIAIFQLVCGIMLLIFGILTQSLPELLADLGFNQDDDSTNSTSIHFDPNGGDKVESHSGHVNAGAVEIEFMGSASIMIISSAVSSILLSGVLLAGAITRYRPLCMMWFVISIIGFIPTGLRFISSIMFGIETNLLNTYRDVHRLMNVYFLWVVWTFMKEIKGGYEKRTDSPDANSAIKP